MRSRSLSARRGALQGESASTAIHPTPRSPSQSLPTPRLRGPAWSPSDQPSHPLDDGLSDVVRRIFLNEMEPRDLHLGLRWPSADEVEIRAGEDRTGLGLQEQLGHIALPQPVRVGGHDRNHVGGLPLDGDLPGPRGTYLIVTVQVLDGISAAVLGVTIPLIVADIMRGTGRFNLGLGIIGSAVGIGAALSNTVAGYVVDHFGSSIAFFGLAFIALCGPAPVWLLPETRRCSSEWGERIADQG